MRDREVRVTSEPERHDCRETTTTARCRSKSVPTCTSSTAARLTGALTAQEPLALPSPCRRTRTPGERTLTPARPHPGTARGAPGRSSAEPFPSSRLSAAAAAASGTGRAGPRAGCRVRDWCTSRLTRARIQPSECHSASTRPAPDTDPGSAPNSSTAISRKVVPASQPASAIASARASGAASGPAGRSPSPSSADIGRSPDRPDRPDAQYRAVIRNPTPCSGSAPAPDPDPESLALSRRRASRENSSDPMSPRRRSRTNRQARL